MYVYMPMLPNGTMTALNLAAVHSAKIYTVQKYTMKKYTAIVK